MSGLKEDIAYIWDGIKMSASEGWTKFKVAKGNIITEGSSAVYRFFSSLGSGMKQGIDKSVMHYIPKEDLAFMKENDVHLYSSDKTVLAGHQTALNAVVINPKSFKTLNNNAACETFAHHEVQHARDIKKLEKNGFTATDLGHGGSGVSGLDRSSQLLLQGVLEARGDYQEKMLSENKNASQTQKLTLQENVKNEQLNGLKARLSAQEIEKNKPVTQQENRTSLKDSLKTASVKNDSNNNAGTNNTPTAVQIASVVSQWR